MRTLRELTLIMSMLVLAWGIGEVALTVRAVRLEITGLRKALETEVAQSRQSVISEVHEAQHMLDRQVTSSRVALIDELRATRMQSLALVDAHAEAIESVLESEIGSMRSSLTDNLTAVVQPSVALIEEYKAIPGEIRSGLKPWVDCRGNGACWPAQITATLGATRATLGQVARSTPRIAASVERSAEASEQATHATAEAMQNVASITKPLPKWVRLPLQILGPSAPLWAPFVFR